MDTLPGAPRRAQQPDPERIPARKIALAIDQTTGATAGPLHEHTETLLRELHAITGIALGLAVVRPPERKLRRAYRWASGLTVARDVERPAAPRSLRGGLDDLVPESTVGDAWSAAARLERLMPALVRAVDDAHEALVAYCEAEPDMPDQERRALAPGSVAEWLGILLANVGDLGADEPITERRQRIGALRRQFDGQDVIEALVAAERRSDRLEEVVAQVEVAAAGARR